MPSAAAFARPHERTTSAVFRVFESTPASSPNDVITKLRSPKGIVENVNVSEVCATIDHPVIFALETIILKVNAGRFAQISLLIKYFAGAAFQIVRL